MRAVTNPSATEASARVLGSDNQEGFLGASDLSTTIAWVNGSLSGQKQRKQYVQKAQGRKRLV